MALQFPCLVYNRAVAENHKTVQCNLCDSWVHIAYNNLNLYTYQKLEKDKSPRHCMYCFRKELPYGSIDETKLRDLLHGEAVVSLNPKIISNRIKQSKYFHEETLKRQIIGFTHLMNLTLYSKASVWHHNCSVCTSTYPLYLINTLSYIIYFQILKLNQTYLEYLKLDFKGVSNHNQYFSSKLCLWIYPYWIRERKNTFIYWQKHKIQAA